MGDVKDSTRAVLFVEFSRPRVMGLESLFAHGSAELHTHAIPAGIDADLLN